MNLTHYFLLVFATVSAFCRDGFAQNLILNGSFESPGNLTKNSSILLLHGDTHLTGWEIGGSGGYLGYANGQVGTIDFPPVDGEYHVSFNGGDQSPGTFITQTFDTVTGGDYAITFFVGRHGPGTGAVSLTATVATETGVQLAASKAVPPAHGYGSQQRFVFTATTGRSTLTITDTSVATLNVDVALDAVNVSRLTPKFDLTSLKLSRFRGFQLQVSTPSPGARLTIETSSDLIRWEPLIFFLEPPLNIELVDPSATNSSPRFYRAFLP